MARPHLTIVPPPRTGDPNDLFHAILDATDPIRILASPISPSIPGIPTPNSMAQQPVHSQYQNDQHDSPTLHQKVQAILTESLNQILQAPCDQGSGSEVDTEANPDQRDISEVDIEFSHQDALDRIESLQITSNVDTYPGTAGCHSASSGDMFTTLNSLNRSHGIADEGGKSHTSADPECADEFAKGAIEKDASAEHDLAESDCENCNSSEEQEVTHGFIYGENKQSNDAHDDNEHELDSATSDTSSIYSQPSDSGPTRTPSTDSWYFTSTPESRVVSEIWEREEGDSLGYTSEEYEQSGHGPYTDRVTCSSATTSSTGSTPSISSAAADLSTILHQGIQSRVRRQRQKRRVYTPPASSPSSMSSSSGYEAQSIASGISRVEEYLYMLKKFRHMVERLRYIIFETGCAPYGWYEKDAW